MQTNRFAPFLVAAILLIRSSAARPTFATRQDCSGSSRSRALCPMVPGSCCCKSGDTTKSSITVHCKDIDHVPQHLPATVTHLTLKYTRIVRLDETSLNRTQLGLLLDFKLSEDEALERIDSRTFDGFRELQTVTIEIVPGLTYISESAFRGAPKLRAIVLKGTGITRVQGFSQLPGPFGRPQLKITLSDNRQLTSVPRHAISNVTSVDLEIKIITNPSLTTVEDRAFWGSKVTKLVLDYNENLAHFSDEALSGIENLHELSLKGTAVSSLPTTGMDTLSKLDITDTPNLISFNKDDLPSLHEALVTYPSHCCALNSQYGFGSVFRSESKPENLVPCEAEDPWHEPIEILQPSDELIPDLTVYDLTGHGTDANESVISLHDHDFSYTGEVPSDLINYAPEGDGTSFYDFTLNSDPVGGGESAPTDTHHPWRAATNDTSNKSMDVTRMCVREPDGTLRQYVYRSPITCSPHPEDFNPCENLLGHPGLVVVSWGVATLAVLGNFFVIFVLVAVAVDKSRTQQRHLSVPKFLILNLAFADLCMGIYVFALSAMDGKSAGEYYKYAVAWQAFGGCDVIGFLSVFSSQLSIYTLSVISLERWYAIRYAIQLDKRMTLKCGRIIMLVGWILSLLFATLPVVGVNSYKRTAVCLPMDVRTRSGTAYVAALLSIDIVAFMIVIGSYLSMYAIVRSADGLERGIKSFFRLQRRRKAQDEFKPRTSHSGSEGCYGAMNSRKADARVAKRMAVLVFTDFACFFPICFFSLFALAGLPLLSMSTAKILLVACFPFNACCNPFLYAILTKSFRKDAKTFYKTHRHSLYGDDRQKARPTEKRSDGGSRQEERRKTIQVYVEGDQQNTNGDVALVSLDHKSANARNGSVGGRSPTRAPGQQHHGNHATCSLTTVKVAETNARTFPDKSKPLPNHNHNNNNSSGKERSHRVLGVNVASTNSTDSEERLAISKRLAMLALLRNFPMFKRRKRLGTDTSRQTYDTQVSANGAVALFEGREADSAGPEEAKKTGDDTIEMKCMATAAEIDLERKVPHCEGESCI